MLIHESENVFMGFSARSCASMKTLLFTFIDSLSPICNVAETDFRQLGGDKMEHFNNASLGGTGFVKGQNSWPRMIMPSLRISSDSTTINQLALGKVKDGIIRSPSLGKAFQLH